MKKYLLLLITMSLVLTLGACAKSTTSVTVLTSSGYEPYEIVGTDGKLTGFDIELMEALAAEVGVEIVWKDVDFDGITASLQAGQAEMAIAGMSPTAERALMVDFSDLYYDSEGGLVNYLVFDSESGITSLEDLEGLVVGAQLGTIQADIIQDLSTTYNFTVDLRNTNTQIIEEINAERIDVLVVESLVSDSILEANSSLAKLELDYSTAGLSGNAIAFTKGSEYLSQFNEALATLIENGTVDSLIEKWFN